MFFTQEDYRKIYDWIKVHSIKDSEFSDSKPLDGRETITVVQQGHNVKFILQDFLEQLALLNIPDFVNVTERYNLKYISLFEAIKAIPYRSRKIGQVITFLDEDGNWKIYQFRGEKRNQWNILTLWVDILEEIIGKGSIIPDEEDLTAVKEGDKTIVKFKDKAYNPDNFSGKGRVYLRKNITQVEDPTTHTTKTVNLLTQSMIDKENTIYIIQYDYDLNGQTITIPEGCIFQFEGGSFKNGLIKNWNQAVFPEYFGAKGDGIADDTESFVMMCNSLYEDIDNNRNFKFKHNVIQLKEKRTYLIGETLFINPTTIIKGNSSMILPKANNKFISYGGYKFILCVGVNKDLNDISYEYAPRSIISDIRVNKTSNYIENLSFCLYGSSLHITNCMGYNLENFIYNFNETSSTLYCDDMSLIDIRLFYYKNHNPSYDYTKPMIRKTCNGDGFYMKNIINESHHYLLTISGSSEGVVIESSLHVDGVISGASVSIIGCHNERCKLLIFRSRVTISDTTFVNQLDDNSIIFNPAYQYGNSYLYLNNCIFYKDTFNIDNSDKPDIVTNPRDYYNIKCNNTWSVCRRSAVNIEDIYYVNNDFITISTGNNQIYFPVNEWIEIKDITFNSYSISSSRGTLPKGKYTYNLYYYIPNLNIGIKHIVVVDNTKDMICFTANFPIFLPVYIEREYNGTVNSVQLQLSGNNVFIDDGEYINGITWSSAKNLTILDLLKVGDKVLYDGTNYKGYLQDIKNVELNNINIEILNRNLSYSVELNKGRIYKIFKKADVINYSCICTLKSANIDYTIAKENSTYSIYGSTGIEFKQDNDYIYIRINANYRRLYIIYSSEYIIPEDITHNSLPSVSINFDELSEISVRNIGIPYLDTDPINKNPGYMYYNYGTRELLISDVNHEFVTLDGFPKGLPRRGSSASRPTFESGNKGFQYFDTILNKPIWWAGSKWVDSEGNDVDSTPITSGTFANKPTGVDVGYAYFCTDKQTTEGTTNGIMIYYKGSNTWVDALGRVVS